MLTGQHRTGKVEHKKGEKLIGPTFCRWELCATFSNDLQENHGYNEPPSRVSVPMKSDAETTALATSSAGRLFPGRGRSASEPQVPPVSRAPPHRGPAKGTPHLHVQDGPRVAHHAGVAHRQGVVAALQLKLLEGQLDDLRGGKESDSAWAEAAGGGAGAAQDGAGALLRSVSPRGPAVPAACAEGRREPGASESPSLQKLTELKILSHPRHSLSAVKMTLIRVTL